VVRRYRRLINKIGIHPVANQCKFKIFEFGLIGNFLKPALNSRGKWDARYNKHNRGKWDA
jgi:hypothetical protein